MRRAEPYPRPVVSEEKEPLQPIDIPTAPLDTPKTVELMIVTKTAETSSKAIERTTVNIAAKKKKVSVVKKKKKVNLQPLISLHVPPYLMVDDIKNQQARITFRQLLEVALKCHSELIRGIRKPTVQKMNLDMATALYCDAMVKGTEIPLIIDSGATRSIVSCQLIKDLKIPIDRPSTTMMVNVNVVTEAESYAAIVGNDCRPSECQLNIGSCLRRKGSYKALLIQAVNRKKTMMDQKKKDKEETDDDSIKEEEEEFEDDEPEE
ncbi:unnamed protein product [Rhizophagus irregularis]|nr:unnamed protein product [Rhizophagus irregularis]CAB5335625.1 unnamed protein product [Rhizophagus irregularis]